MSRSPIRSLSVLVLAALAASGCCSPYRSDRGALFGGLLGAGTGAIVGNAVGNAGAGTAIGAGIGALTGAAVGDQLDQIEAQNRAMIEQRLGRQLAAGAVSMTDVVAMSKAGVADDLIITHIRTHGVATLPTSDEIIFLTQQGVSPAVIKAMQSPMPPQGAMAPPGQPVLVPGAVPAPVIVEEYHYGPPPFHPPYRYGCRPGPGVSWGMAVSN